jgi:hypothetical protein
VSSKRLIRKTAPATPPPLPGRTAAGAALSSSPADGSHGVPPLQWWRRLTAHTFTGMHVATIQRAVAGITIINEPCWPAAANGNPAVAVGVALRSIRRSCIPSPGFDLVMSALLRCAIEGSTTAALVLRYALGRMAVKDPACAPVAASWQTATVRPRSHRAPKGA